MNILKWFSKKSKKKNLEALKALMAMPTTNIYNAPISPQRRKEWRECAGRTYYITE